MEEQLNRIQARLCLESLTDKQKVILTELYEASYDIVALYVEQDELPNRILSIVVMMAVDGYNRLGSEGSTATSKDVISQSFYTNLLEPYEPALDKFIAAKSKKKVVFL